MKGPGLLSLPLALAAALGGCGGGAVASADAAASVAVGWRQVATSADRTRIRNARATWVAALAAARSADAAAVTRGGALFEIDSALADPMLPAGTYRCRTIKLGRQGAMGAATPGYIDYPWFECQVDGAGQVAEFFKTSGSQRPVGRIFPDGSARAVFLGTLVLGDESGALQYGRDATRDMAGIVERIGPKRWRIAFPEPSFESKLDVTELVPAN